MQEEAERLRDIVNDLLEFAHPRPALFAPAAIDDVVRAAIEAARGEAAAGEEDVVLDIDGPTQIVCDARLVRHAAINLVTNALHAPERKGPVRVRIVNVVGAADAETQEGSLFIRVIDDGVGIPAELHERIFAPFYSTRPTGTGLGRGGACVRRVARRRRRGHDHTRRAEILRQNALFRRGAMVALISCVIRSMRVMKTNHRMLPTGNGMTSWQTHAAMARFFGAGLLVG